MSPKTRAQFENKALSKDITELQKMYGKPPGVELQELVNMFHSCKQAKGQSVSDHVFKNEVENQLGKTIKAIRSDRGGEYISQEFKDYQKAYGIVQHYTSLHPQHKRDRSRSTDIEVEDHSLGDLNEPANYKAALSDPEFEKWLVAMNEEMQSMNDNKVWKLVVLPPNAKVVKRFHSEEIFSPVADIRAIRILIAIAAYYDYEIWQIDVKTAFLNGFLEEEIYMEQPEGFIDPNHPSKVCKVQRSIYGLKQASRSWNKRFDEEIKKFSFHQNLDEPCVYQKASGRMYNSQHRSRRLIGLSQNAYLDKILKRYRMDNSKHGSIPMQVDLHLSKSQCATTSAEMKRICETKSQTGNVFVLNGGAVVWKSSKQSTTAQHAIEAEYIAAFEAVKEAV
ncbi:retrotransposon protein, putative, ty1-copia subclass [Tanacetum coccineum]